MSFNDTSDERFFNGLEYGAGYWDAPDYFPNNSYVLAEGFSKAGYGALIGVLDSDHYNLGTLTPGRYTVHVDQWNWDFSNSIFGFRPDLTLYRNGLYVDTDYFGDISFVVESTSSYSIKIDGTVIDSEYRVYYTYDGPINHEAFFSNPTHSGTIADGELVSSNVSVTDLDGIPEGSLVTNWYVDGVLIWSSTTPEVFLVQSDVGKELSYQVEFFDSVGNYELSPTYIIGTVLNQNDSPTGNVGILGVSATEGETLTADTSSLADADGLGAFSYQWLRDGAVITGATNSTYLLSQGDVGTTISVQVSYTDGYGTLESVTSGSTPPVTNTNSSPAGNVDILGASATEGETLTADTSGLADEDGLGAFSYQWLRDGVAIADATDSTYLLTQQDVGTAISVQVSYTDGGGTGEQVTSGETPLVANVNDSPIGDVTITGSPTQDETLTTDTSGLADEDGLGAFSYQWLRDGVAITGATDSTYLLTQEDVGTSISVQVSYTDGGGTGEQVTSGATAPIENINDEPTGSVIIAGTAIQGETLTVDTSTLADEDGLGEFSYQWLRNGAAIDGATMSTYILTQTDVGTTIRVQIAYTDNEGTDEEILSTVTNPVGNLNDEPTGSLVIAGTAIQGEILTVDTSAVADADGLGNFSYQWQADGVDILGATGSSLILGQAEVGKAITVITSYTDGGGTAESVSSEATAPIANVNDEPTGSIVITGNAIQGDILTVDASTLADEDGLGSLSYQWQANGDNIAGATNATLVLGQAQVGKTITVVASYTDGGGTAESVSSEATAPIENINDEPTGSIVITGNAIQGDILTVDTSAVADADGLGNFSYQWQADGVDILGATDPTLVLGQTQVGKTITVVASYTDGGGTAESVTSEATAAIANVNDAPSGTVLISGSATEGQLLTAEVGALEDPDGLGDFSYQWLRNGAVIAGANQTSYQLTSEDVAQAISVAVSYVDGGGAAESLTSGEVLVSQYQVTGAFDFNGAPVDVTLLSDSDDSLIISNFSQQPAPVTVPPELALPLGLLIFEAQLSAAGKTQQFSLFVDDSVPVGGYFKQDSDGHWVNLASAIVHEDGKIRVDFSLTDGGEFDADGIANGIIVDPGALGTAARPELTLEDKILALYIAYFDRAPDAGGVSFWLEQAENGQSLYEISGGFANHPRFAQEYGGLSNQEIAEKIYLNVLRRPGDADGINYWTNRLDNEPIAEVVVEFVVGTLEIDLDTLLADGELTADVYSQGFGRQKILENLMHASRNFLELFGEDTIPDASPDQVAETPAYQAAVAILDQVDSDLNAVFDLRDSLMPLVGQPDTMQGVLDLLSA
jgi:hypothetical protein